MCIHSTFEIRLGFGKGTGLHPTVIRNVVQPLTDYISRAKRVRVRRGVRAVDVGRRVLSGLVKGGSVWAESFLFAGTSALLLLVAGLFPAYWYLSFIALAPFLFRMIRADVMEALRLGFFLGLAYFSVLLVDALLPAPFAALPKILGGTLLFSLFGMSVGLARRKWGFNPFIVALLWVVFELGLIKLGLVHGFFESASLSSPFLHGLAALFGFLIISVVIVLAASILALALETAIKLVGARRRIVTAGRSTWVSDPTSYIYRQKFYLVPDGRGPPAPSLFFA